MREFPEVDIEACVVSNHQDKFDDMIKIVESLYDRDSTRATLWLRRLQAWGLYVCVLSKLEKIPQLLEHPLALRACVLIFVTRIAL